VECNIPNVELPVSEICDPDKTFERRYEISLDPDLDEYMEQ